MRAYRSNGQSAEAIRVFRDLESTLDLELGVAPEKIHVIRRGVDAAVFHPGNRLRARQDLGLPLTKTLYVWAGRHGPVKGLPTLVEAAAQLRRWNSNFHCYLIGEGPQQSELQNHVERAELRSHISFVPAVRHDENAVGNAQDRTAHGRSFHNVNTLHGNKFCCFVLYT